MNTDKDKIKYILIGKADDLKEIGEYPFQTNMEYAKDCRTIFTSYCSSNIQSKIDSRNKVKAKHTNNNHYFYISDQRIFFISVVESTYPESNVFKMFDEIQKENVHLLRDDKGKLNSIGINKLKEIFNSFQNASESSIFKEINKDIDGLKGDMKKNITKIVGNIEDSEKLKDRAEAIKEQSNAFYEQSNELKKQSWWQNMKLWLILGVIIVLLILIIVVPIVVSSNNKKKDEQVIIINVSNSTNTTDIPKRFLL